MVSLNPLILVVEDDPAVRLSLRLACEKDGMVVAEAATGAEALQRLAARLPDLVLLDLMLPDMRGFDVCRAIRQQHPHLPIIIITARGDEVDKVTGLELGADDYVTKPFSPRELVARIRAVLRRASRPVEAALPAEEIALGDLRLRPAEREAWVRGQRVPLTRTEFDLLATLAAQPGRVFTRDELVTRIRGFYAAGETRLLDSHIGHLRAKIEPDPRRPRYILTVRDVGYKLNPAP